MPALQQKVMNALYRHDIWSGFQPTPGSVMQGWNGDHPSLGRLAGIPGEKLVIDIGVWKGQSTITMASALKEQGIDGCVIAVDTFLGSPEHWINGAYFVRTHGFPDLYQTFMSNVLTAGVQNYVVPMPQTSTTAAMVLAKTGLSASIIHVDAAHEYREVLQDVTDYWPLLASGGYMIGDDYHETWPGVIQAAGEFSARVTCPLTIETPKWILRKP